MSIYCTSCGAENSNESKFCKQCGTTLIEQNNNGQALSPIIIPTSGMAIASMVLGILGLLTAGVFSIFGIIFGHISRSKIKNSRGTLSGDGFALAGLITGYIGIAFMLVILLIGVGSIAMLLNLSSTEEPKMERSFYTKKVTQEPQMVSSFHSNTTTDKIQKKDSFTLGKIYPIEVFTVNILSETGRRYLTLKMDLELDSEKLTTELDSKTAVVRDIIIRLLASKSLEDLNTPTDKDKLKKQIVDALNMKLSKGSIKNIYFEKFVIQ